jgi:hypothetical protein
LKYYNETHLNETKIEEIVEKSNEEEVLEEMIEINYNDDISEKNREVIKIFRNNESFEFYFTELTNSGSTNFKNGNRKRFTKILNVEMASLLYQQEKFDYVPQYLKDLYDYFKNSGKFFQLKLNNKNN